MPYFRNKHILFIHIPKTGGSSVENLLSENDIMSLKTPCDPTLLPSPYNTVTLQHQLYTTIYQYREKFKIEFNDKLRIFAIVRNPYHRLVSELFWRQLITTDMSQIGRAHV